MTTASLENTTLASSSYAALRHGGTPAGQARVQLGLKAQVAARLERHFQARSGGGLDPMRPRFAKHAQHVRAVLAQGGYPALPGRGR